MKLRLAAVLDGPEVSPRLRAVTIASLIVAGFVAVASLGGILSFPIYAREMPSWRAQGIGQDWANLVVAVPWLIASALYARRGSRSARLVLGSGLFYACYAYTTYAFDVHFNALFLIYCAILGGSAYALAALASEVRDAQTWYGRDAPVRLPGGFAMACAVGFALLWLSQIVPALLAGTAPAGLDEVGLVTNPVHVLDLSFVLPAMFAGGWLLWHRRPLGYVIVPIFLGFAVVMGASLVGMAVALYAAQLSSSLALVIGFAVFALASGAILVWLLRAIADRGASLALTFES